MNTASLPSKITHLKPNETMVLFPDDYKVFMRTLAACMHRKQIDKVSYKKALVIIDEQLQIGVAITKES
jgi:hypothetical protein